MKPFSGKLGLMSLLFGLVGPAMVPLAGAEPRHGLVRPADGERVPFHQAATELAQADIVLVGEHHDRPGDHRAQAQLIQGLLAHRPVVVGLEPLPRSSNGALERWRQGDFEDIRVFLGESGWYRHWGMAASLYRPVLEVVRLNGLPAVGMNIPREWVNRVARQGMPSLPAEARAAIGEVAPPTEAYRQALGKHFRAHRQGEGGRQTDSEGLSGFAAAQAVWDAAMAEALYRARQDHPDALVVGVVGSGHLRSGLGIQRQLETRDGDLRVATVLPFYPGGDLERPGKGEADLAWALPGERVAPGARLGVHIDADAESEDNGLLVEKVVEGSSADQAGVRAGDRLLAVDGRELRRFADLVHGVKRHHWGECLRLKLQRDGEEQTLSVALSPAGAAQLGPNHGSK